MKPMKRRQRSPIQTGFSTLDRAIDLYTRDVTAEGIRRLFVRDAREAYEFLLKGIDRSTLERQPFPKRAITRLRLFLVAFSNRLPPARRALYGLALLCTLIGLLPIVLHWNLSGLTIGSVSLPLPGGSPITFYLLAALALLNLLVILEVADRLVLKHDLAVARDIQLAMLPQGAWVSPGIDACGETRPANSVGGDFYDIRTCEDARVLLAVGDVAGKGTPAALLMTLVVASLRTLADDRLTLQALAARLNTQVLRHAPASRFVTLFVATYCPDTRELVYVNAGHTPPLLCRASGDIERLPATSVALGMFEQAPFEAARVLLEPGDLLVACSDGVTEAESPRGDQFEDEGVIRVLRGTATLGAPEICRTLTSAVDAHVGDAGVQDDLTVLAARMT
jgi:sigma-B regulation protein RsbU (phosphoserine phosphatase)